MKKAFIILTAVALCISMLAGCGSAKPENAAPQSQGGGEGGPQVAKELYIYNSKGENAEQFAKMCADYEKISGIKVKAFSIGSGQDHMETLRAEMNSSNMPAVFSIQGLKELIEWQDAGFVLDFKKAPDGEFKKLADSIPDSLRLKTGDNSYGIPYNVEGYGYIADTQMLKDLFDLTDAASLVADIKAASYEEWEALVKAIDAYIKAPSATKVKVNGNEYIFAAAKTGLAQKLTGVFAVMGSQKWTYGDHFINVALNAAFSSPSEANVATKEQIQALKPALINYMKALDLKTSYLAGANGPEKRGQNFVVDTNYGYDQTVQIFADSKAVFIKQGNWAFGNINNVNAEVAKRLTFLPVKMPFKDSDIKAPGQTVSGLNSTIPVFVPNYYAVNAKVDEATQKAAMDFLVWLNTSNEGKKYITEDFAFIPYNADPATTSLGNSLGNSILEYIKAGKTLAAPYHGAPSTWSGDVVGLKLLESYMTKEKWTEKDYEDVADFAIDQWISLAGL